MKYLLIGTALIALCGARAQSQQPEDMEEHYSGWRPVGLDLRLGTAFFVAPQNRSGNAVLYHILTVDRIAIGEAKKFDKEMMQLLADCGTRKVPTIDHRHQLGDAVMPRMITFTLPPDAPEPGSVDDTALKAVCGDHVRAIPIVEHPYAWAKVRLREGGAQR
ncbi:MAG TPA: hypothetical protein VF548_16370 [Allosphingosinicella sp.]|jgi:hypothetical protein